MVMFILCAHGTDECNTVVGVQTARVVVKK
jgi:hypothetical protein